MLEGPLRKRESQPRKENRAESETLIHAGVCGDETWRNLKLSYSGGNPALDFGFRLGEIEGGPIGFPSRNGANTKIRGKPKICGKVGRQECCHSGNCPEAEKPGHGLVLSMGCRAGCSCRPSQDADYVHVRASSSLTIWGSLRRPPSSGLFAVGGPIRESYDSVNT